MFPFKCYPSKSVAIGIQSLQGVKGRRLNLRRGGGGGKRKEVKKRIESNKKKEMTGKNVDTQQVLNRMPVQR